MSVAVFCPVAYYHILRGKDAVCICNDLLPVPGNILLCLIPFHIFPPSTFELKSTLASAVSADFLDRLGTTSGTLDLVMLSLNISGTCLVLKNCSRAPVIILLRAV